MSKSRENELGDKKTIWREALIGYKRPKYFLVVETTWIC